MAIVSSGVGSFGGCKLSSDNPWMATWVRPTSSSGSSSELSELYKPSDSGVWALGWEVC